MSVCGNEDILVPAVTIKWTVAIRQVIVVPDFLFNGAVVKLLYDNMYGEYHGLRLERVSGVYRHPFHTSVQVERVLKGRIVTDLLQVRRITKAEKYNFEHIWNKREVEVLGAVPELHLYKVLKLHVVLKTGELSLAGNDSVATQTDCSIPESVEVSCLESLSEDLAQLMVRGSDPDVEFQCGGQSTGAHKSIVCSRSPVLASMLAADMVEGRTGVVKIPNIEPDIFQQFLRYLYSGRVQELTFDTALALYEVGDQYGVCGLARRCSDCLEEHLSVENACEVLAVADARGNSKIVEKAIEFILENKIPVVRDRWSAFCSDHPELAIRVLTHFYKLSTNVGGNWPWKKK